MVHYVRDRLAFGDQLHSLCLQRGHRTGLECEMIERSWDAQSFVDAGVVIGRYGIYALGLHERDKLAVPHVEEYVPDAPALFDLDDIATYRFETQNVLVEVTGLVQVQG